MENAAEPEPPAPVEQEPPEAAPQKVPENNAPENKAPENKTPENQRSVENAEVTPPAPEKDSAQSVAAIIAELYVLRAHYTNALEEMRRSALADYDALSSEQKTNAAKQNIGLEYLKRAGTLESECDSRMEDVLSRLEKELKNSGNDVSIINDVRSTYANEKSLMKAYYMNMYR